MRSIAEGSGANLSTADVDLSTEALFTTQPHVLASPLQPTATDKAALKQCNAAGQGVGPRNRSRRSRADLEAVVDAPDALSGGRVLGSCSGKVSLLPAGIRRCWSGV